MTAHDVLIVLSRRYNNDFNLVYKAIKEKERFTEWDLISAQNWMKDNDLKAIFISDLDYPDILRRGAEPPIVIYYQGDNLLKESPILSLVGSKHSISLEEAPEKLIYLDNDTIIEKDGDRVMNLKPEGAPPNDPLLRYLAAERLYIGLRDDDSRDGEIINGITGSSLRGNGVEDILVEYQEGLNAELIDSGATLVKCSFDFATNPQKID